MPHSEKINLLWRSSNNFDEASAFDKCFLIRTKILMTDFVIQGQLYAAWMCTLFANESVSVSQRYNLCTIHCDNLVWGNAFSYYLDKMHPQISDSGKLIVLHTFVIPLAKSEIVLPFILWRQNRRRPLSNLATLTPTDLRWRREVRLVCLRCQRSPGC